MATLTKELFLDKIRFYLNEEKEIRYPLGTIEELWDFLLTDIKAYFKNVWFICSTRNNS